MLPIDKQNVMNIFIYGGLKSWLPRQHVWHPTSNGATLIVPITPPHYYTTISVLPYSTFRVWTMDYILYCDYFVWFVTYVRQSIEISSIGHSLKKFAIWKIRIEKAFGTFQASKYNDWWWNMDGGVKSTLLTSLNKVHHWCIWVEQMLL